MEELYGANEIIPGDSLDSAIECYIVTGNLLKKQTK